MGKGNKSSRMKESGWERDRFKVSHSIAIILLLTLLGSSPTTRCKTESAIFGDVIRIFLYKYHRYFDKCFISTHPMFDRMILELLVVHWNSKRVIKHPSNVHIIRYVLTGMGAHRRIGVVAQVRFRGRILVLDFGSGQNQWSSTIRLKIDEKTAHPLVGHKAISNFAFIAVSVIGSIFTFLDIHRKKYTRRRASSS